jgi:head-tail adaptor
MKSGAMDRQIGVWRKSTTQDATYGTEIEALVPLVAAAGSPVVPERWWAEVQDVMPSRSESIKQGLNISALPTRVRLRYRSDIDSSMLVDIYGDGDPVRYSIIGGPAAIGGRKQRIELLLERYSTE